MKFYVYELKDETGLTFYVGKGQGNRMMHHALKARRGIESHTCEKIRSIWSRGGEVRAMKVFLTDNEEAAFAEEKRLIPVHGRENLTNKTDGGDGPCNPSQDVRDRIAAGRRGLVASEETRLRLRNSHLGLKHSDETKRKIAAFQSGFKKPWARLPRSEEHRRKLATFKGRKHTAEAIAKISAAKMGHSVSQETKDKISESKKGAIPWNKGVKAVPKAAA